MGKARAEIDIDKPADEVWAVVGDFGGIGDWMPGIESCLVDGDDRILKMGGMEIIERLERRDDDEREIVYGIVRRRPGHQPQGHHHRDPERAARPMSPGTSTSTTRCST